MDHGDEQQVAPQRKKKRLQVEEDQEYLRRVLSTYEGRAVLWKLLEDLNLFSPVPVLNDMAHLARAQAEQNVGKRVLSDVLTADVNSFNIMRDEAAKRELRSRDGG